MKEKQRNVKNQILDAAELLFSERRYDDVSVQDIAKASLISRRTIYNYFTLGKDDIYFAVGNRIYQEENIELASQIPKDLSGLEQVLFLCRKRYQNGFLKPMEHQADHQFSRLMLERDLSSESIYSSILDKIGEEKLNEIVQAYNAEISHDLLAGFDEPYLIEFYIQFLRHSRHWINAVEKGKQDKSIKNKYEPMHIIQFISAMIVGTVYDLKFRKSALDRIALDIDSIIVDGLILIKYYLENDMNKVYMGGFK